MSLEHQIDDLYKQSPAEFTAARIALAKTLKGEEASRVKALRKPTAAPWVVNQIYWRARSVYDRLRTAGDRLRTGQIAALGERSGRGGDVARAGETHRQALSAAVREGTRLASANGVKVNVDDLTRLLQAVSLTRELPEPPGRLTTILQPPGFEALAGVPIKARPADGGDKQRAREEKQAQAKAGRRRAAIEDARKSVARAGRAEEHARGNWERAKEALAAAERALSDLEEGAS